MSKPFHLAIAAGNLDTAIDFYKNVLGCKLGNGEKISGLMLIFGETNLLYTKLKLNFQERDMM